MGKTLAQVFEGISKIMEEQKEEQDKKGYSEIYKKGTEILFKEIQNNLIEYQSSFKSYGLEKITYEDVSYGDGYFIFSFGTNSVVTFKIKECPGWLFGLWWSEDESVKDEKKRISGEFFTQYEEEIDKFKPSASSYCENVFYVEGENKISTWSYHITQMIAYIHKYPELAFYREQHYLNYNYEYVDLRKAKRYFENYKKTKEETESKRQLFVEEILNYWKEKLSTKGIKGYEVIDRGSSWSPRYKIIAPLKENLDLFEESGSYNICETEKEYKSAVKDIRRIENKYKKYYFYATSVVHEDIYVCDEKEGD